MRWKLILPAAAAAPALIAGSLLLTNNVRLSAPSRADFERRLERTREAARDWVLVKDMAAPEIQKKRLRELLGNSALMYMLADCDRLAAAGTFAPLVRLYFENAGARSSWTRLVDPAKPFVDPDKDDFDRLLDYQRWFLWAMAPDRVRLAPEEKADLDSPDGMHRGRLTHQIFAWNLHRRLHGATPEHDRLIRHLCERAAEESVFDVRVTDQYLQRIAFVLDAGHPDLIRPSWVERALDGQQDDGGWTWAWHGWGPQAFQIRLPEENSSAHPTAQGLWITYLLKYRYPEWIRAHYR